MQEKLETGWNLNLINSRRPYLEDYIYIVTNNALDFKQLYILSFIQ